MNSKSYSWAIGLTFVSLSAACTGTSEGTSEGSSSGDLSATVSSLANAEDSFESARAAAKACFDAFRTCVQADEADVAACRATLRDCLPDEAPLPPRCGGDDGDANADEGDQGDDNGDASEPPAGHRPPPGGDGAIGPGLGFGGDGKDCDRGGDGDTGGDGDVGPGDGDGDTGDGDDDGDTGDGDTGDGDGDTGGGDLPVDVKLVRLDRGMGEGGVCERPEVPGDRFHGCRDEVEATLDNGGSAEDARDAALSCVGDAFAEHLAELCARAADFCAGDDAPAELCAKITDACASVTDGG